MSTFRRFLSRRWLLAVPVILFGLAMLHPYPRQSLFGPTVRGEPWCVWENEVRRKYAEPGDGFLADINRALRRWVFPGPEQKSDAELFDHPEMLPIVIALLHDPDKSIRLGCISAIVQFPNLQDRSALPALWKIFQKDDLNNQCLAGRAIWQIDKDKRVVRWYVELLQQDGREERLLSTNYAIGLCADAPELFPHLTALAKDESQAVRTNVLYAMSRFGKKGLPILIAGLRDPVATVRSDAAIVAGDLGPDARDAIPALEGCLQDADRNVVAIAAQALRKIDPARFQRLQADGKIE